MKNWWTKIGCLLTGWNFRILQSCTEASRKQLKKYTSALLILIILWGLIGYLFAERYVNAPWWGCVITAVVMIIVVLQIERQIILTVGKNCRLAIFRIVIASIMALIGSAIIDQIIFKDDIEKKMIEIVDRQVNEQFPNRIAQKDKIIQKRQMEIDSLDNANMLLYEEIAKKPTYTVASYNTSTTKDSTNRPTSRTVTKTENIFENPKKKQVEMNNSNLERLRNLQEKDNKDKIEIEDKLRIELGEKQGFLEELRAMFEIVFTRLEAGIFYLLLFLFLTSLELFVVFSKIGDNKSDYDLIIEHQLEQKKKTLNELTKAKANLSEINRRF
ncbi:MAG: DUF4407 domain-containing protein [Dysgonamonadaceae bacterium]|jgi:hypothetical protein|nr:DUF4407 domain-containing protein [Dysgonamonadaceae bacterium]